MYLLQNKDKSYRTTKHKCHIGKLMDICLLTCPCYNAETGEWWDGKIGIWTFAEYVAAKRSSHNRPRGTIELKPITVTKEVYMEYMKTYLIPAILDRWPQKLDPNGNYFIFQIQTAYTWI